MITSKRWLLTGLLVAYVPAIAYITTYGQFRDENLLGSRLNLTYSFNWTTFFEVLAVYIVRVAPFLIILGSRLTDKRKMQLVRYGLIGSAVFEFLLLKTSFDTARYATNSADGWFGLLLALLIALSCVGQIVGMVIGAIRKTVKN